MHGKNNLYLKIFTLLTLMLQTVSATTDYYLTYYIPISQPQSEIMDKDGVELYKAILYTFYSEPDTAIDMVTQPYIVQTPHERRDMQNYNINLGAIKGLKVEWQQEYGSKECRVVMDSSKVVSDYSPEELEKILAYVKKATKLNMKEHEVDCAFKEVKAMAPLSTPQPLDLEQRVTTVFAPYVSGIAHVPFLFDKFYPLGYSTDGKIAYAIEYETDPADIFVVKSFIQDLISDKILWEDSYKVEENLSNVDFSSFWRERQAKILEQLKHHHIQFNNGLSFFTKNLSYKKDRLFLYAKNKKRYQKDWDASFLEDSSIYLHSAQKGQKLLDKKFYHDEQLLAREPICYIPLGEQGSRRVAVVVAKLRRGWEGPPHNVGYEIVGANLEVGFKK